MTIDEIQKKTIPIFQQYGITYAGLFGSFARGESTDSSDIDIMVKLGKPMGMFRYMKFIDGLESTLQRKVDVVTEKSLNKHVRPYVTSEIKKIYEE